MRSPLSSALPAVGNRRFKTLNRMNDWVEGCRVTGKILFEGKDIFKEVDPLALRYRVGMVFQQPTPFPKSIYENIAYGPRIQGITNKQKLDEIVEKSLRQAACWDEMKDRLQKSASAFPVASSSVCALPVRWQPTRRSFSWTNRRRHWIQFPRRKSKTWHWN